MSLLDMHKVLLFVLNIARNLGLRDYKTISIDQLQFQLNPNMGSKLQNLLLLRITHVQMNIVQKLYCTKVDSNTQFEYSKKLKSA
jgi:hypothetical protein